MNNEIDAVERKAMFEIRGLNEQLAEKDAAISALVEGLRAARIEMCREWCNYEEHEHCEECENACNLIFKYKQK